jgi:hypothetical protein
MSSGRSDVYSPALRSLVTAKEGSGKRSSGFGFDEKRIKRQRLVVHPSQPAFWCSHTFAEGYQRVGQPCHLLATGGCARNGIMPPTFD